MSLTVVRNVKQAIFDASSKTSCYQAFPPLSLLCLTLLYPMQVNGADMTNHNGQQESDSSIEKITVVATRSTNNSFTVPASVSIITREQLEEAQANTLSSVLRNVPNVNYGGGPRSAAQSPAIRGQQGPRIILSVDGARRNNDGGVHTPLLLEPDLIKQIEIVRGPVSALYGSGGIGGVMAFETISAEDILQHEQSWGGIFKLRHRTVNQESSSSLTLAGQSSNSDILASATYRNYNDIKTGADGEHARYPNDGDLHSGLLKAGYRFNEQHKITLSYQLFSDKFIGPNNPGGNLLFPYMQELERRQTQYSGNWIFQDSGEGLFDGKFSLYQTKFELNADSRSIPAQPATNTVTETLGAGLQNSTLFSHSGWISHRLTYGLDYYRDQNENTSNGQPNTVLPDGKMRTTGIFLQDEVALGKLWSLIAAVRHDSYKLMTPEQDSSHNRATPRVAIKFEPLAAFSIYVSVGEAFRSPTMTEMFANLNTNIALFNFRPNPELKPESSTNREAGFTYAINELFGTGQLRVKGSYFDENVKDLIDSQVVGTFSRQAPFSGTGLIFQRRNIARAERDGAELEVIYAQKALTIGLAYSRLRSRNSENGANLFSPPDKVAFNANYQFNENWSAYYQGDFVKAQDYDTTILRQRSGYALHDIGVSYSTARFRADLGISNLTDKAYATYQQSLADTFSYEEGRSLNLSTTLRF